MPNCQGADHTMQIIPWAENGKVGKVLRRDRREKQFLPFSQIAQFLMTVSAVWHADLGNMCFMCFGLFR